MVFNIEDQLTLAQEKALHEGALQYQALAAGLHVHWPLGGAVG